ncbi:hypothetical protein, partial [Rhodoferax sp.]|uniref:hypothetical protein n=1 Tax=Rhodoferax sp. TaxID=50421 RepID=UPI003BB4E651
MSFSIGSSLEINWGQIPINLGVTLRAGAARQPDGAAPSYWGTRNRGPPHPAVAPTDVLDFCIFEYQEIKNCVISHGVQRGRQS